MPRDEGNLRKQKKEEHLGISQAERQDARAPKRSWRVEPEGEDALCLRPGDIKDEAGREQRGMIWRQQS